MARRGRPKGGDSAETRLRIIDAARTEFASSGFDGASVATIATNADLAPSAVYHYFGGKAALYEEVYETTAETTWADVDSSATGCGTLLENVESLLLQAGKLRKLHPDHNDFLALVPMEASLHPQFAYMLERRAKRQDRTFIALAEIGLATGELKDFDLDSATELLRSLLMGWFLESHFRGGAPEPSRRALTTAIRLLGER